VTILDHKTVFDVHTDTSPLSQDPGGKGHGWFATRWDVVAVCVARHFSNLLKRYGDYLSFIPVAADDKFGAGKKVSFFKRKREHANV
jgi:hypothetical protein